MSHHQEQLLFLQAHQLPLHFLAARRSHLVVVQWEHPVVWHRQGLLHDPRHHEKVPIVQTPHQPLVAARYNLIEHPAHASTRRNHQGKNNICQGII